MKKSMVMTWLFASMVGFGATAAHATAIISSDFNPSPNAENYIFEDLTPSGLFAEDFAFTLNGPRDLVATVQGTGEEISFSSFKLFDSAYNLLTTGTLYNSPTLRFSLGSLVSDTPALSTYHLLLSGNASGISSYSGSISAVAAVPEPETYGMMLFGIGLMSFVARRRKS